MPVTEVNEICGYLNWVIHSQENPMLAEPYLSWNNSMEFAEFESSIIAELNRVLLQATEELESEERLDLKYEVAETVRFEQSHISWLDRLRNTAGTLEVRLNHRQLPNVFGEVSHLADPFMILENSTNQFLINFEFVVAIAGLNELSRRTKTPDSINWLDNVWLHDLTEHRQISSWYLAGDQVIEGFCLRVGFDSLDIESKSKTITLPKRSIVACRTIKSG